MLPDLLKRDLRLHRLLLATPLGILLLAGALGPFQGAENAAPMYGMALLATLLLPLSLHLRELSEGTLGELLALPVSRRDLVRLRFLEGLLFPCGGLLLLALEGLLVHALFGRPTQALASALGSLLASPLGLAWTFLIVVAYPLPAALRWGGKGLAVAVAVPIGLLLLLAQITMHARSGTGILRTWEILTAPWHWIAGHPPAEALLAAALCALAYGLSLRAFAAREL